jgi:plastocyanin
VTVPLRSSRARRSAGGLLAAATLALGVLTGCGGDEPSEGADATTTAASEPGGAEGTESPSPTSDDTDAGAAGTIAVSSVDFSFELDESSFTPGTYEITLTNEGDATHDLVVERDGEDVAASEQIGPGESSTFEVTLEEGDYVFYCSVGNHRSMGMEVPVTVTS